MINRLFSIFPALAFALLAPAVQAQSPSQTQPQSKSQPQPQPSQSKPQPQAQQQPQGGGGFLYKSTMPDGKVIYSDAPEKGAVKVEKSRPDTSKKGITAATPKEMAAAKKADAERSASTGAGGNRVADMQSALEKMQTAREKAREPLEGERIGNAGGGSRFTDAYWERQKKYDVGLDIMQKELDKARAGK